MRRKACYYADMTFFETLVALLAVAILLLQITRRMSNLVEDIYGTPTVE